MTAVSPPSPHSTPIAGPVERTAGDDPVVTTGAVVTALAVLAFVAGLTKRWILDPVGAWFGDRPPGVKAAIVVLVVVAIIGAIAWVRLRHRTRVMAARRVVDAPSADPRSPSPTGPGTGGTRPDGPGPTVAT